MPDFISNILNGVDVALSYTNLLYCLFGVTVGTLVGVIPGIGVLTAISLLFPLTFHMDPMSALTMLAGIYYGTGYGGRIAAILLRIPGEPSSAITTLDGYPMAQQGRGAVALAMTAVASFVGCSVSIILLTVLAPTIADYALSFGAPEYCALMVLGLLTASAISDGSTVKSLAMVILGVMFGTVGADIYTGMPRFTFGFNELAGEISLIALALGLFGLNEIVFSIGKVAAEDLPKGRPKFSEIKPTRDDVNRSWFPLLRGSSTGAFFGILPGAGATIAAFTAYAIEKRVSKEPERFGKGAVEGIMAPEAAENSSQVASFIPTFALGIPGSATMALMLGALMVHGISPGPRLISDNPDMFWGLIVSFWIANLMLIILNIPLIGVWIRLLNIPYRLLFPCILVFICLGMYTVSYSPFDIWMVVFFGAVGCLMRYVGFPPAPLLIGFVLGPLLEENFHRSMLIARGDITIFIERPLSLAILLFAAILLFLAWLGEVRSKARLRKT